MKARDRKQLACAVLSAVPSLIDRGRLLAATPLGRILRGIYLEDSSDPERIYAWAFVQPLYAPASTIVFDFGQRLGGPSRTWGTDEATTLVEAVRNEGVPHFGRMSSPGAIADWSFLDGRSDPHALEAKAYSLVAAGRRDEGVRALRELTQSLSGDAAWIVDMRKRAEQLAKLAEEEPTAADALLGRWESATVAALGILNIP